jgi:dienelactone hydrolase
MIFVAYVLETNAPMFRRLGLLIGLLFILSQAYAQKDSIPDSKYFPAKGKSSNIVLLLLGGSEGGIPNYYDVAKLTGLGYDCFILGYFNTRNTPDRLELIPLEYFYRSIDSLMSSSEHVGKKLVVWGGSKGGELALLLASRCKMIKGVVAVVPSAVVFQGLGGKPVSSWSEGGRPIPFVPFAAFDYSKVVNNQFVEVYNLSLDQKEYITKAQIPVERISGPLLLLSGKADSMWPSDRMTEMIAERLKEKKFPYPYYRYSYENAGHTLNDGYMMGGTKEGNQKAREDAEKKILGFLQGLESK